MTTDSRFGWTDFYMEFADRLLAHKDDRSELVAKVRQVCNDLGHSYLDNSGTAQEGTGLPDICPFTTIGTFNRGISDTNKKKIAEELGRFLGVNEPAPSSFDGIPTLNNQNSVVFWNLRDVEPLWRVLEDAIRFADSGDEHAGRSFLESYDRIVNARGVGAKLTIGLFWIRPNSYPTLDSKSEDYIASSLGVTLPKQVPPQGREYLELAYNLRERFFDADSPVRSFQELSLAADKMFDAPASSSVWLVRAGSEGELEDAALAQGLAIVDWGVGDLTTATDRDAVRERVKQADPEARPGWIRNVMGQLTSFLLEMREGDVVVLPLKKESGIVAIGRITGDYAYQVVDGDHYHTRPVDWVRTDVLQAKFGDELQRVLRNPRTICRIKGGEAENRILAMLGDAPPPPEPEFTIDDIMADGCFLERSEVETILNRLKMKKNLILQGPPGTGKTWLAKKLAFALIGEKDDRRVHRLQFHPNLSYEDFVRGFRPHTNGTLRLVDGPFLEVIKEARDNAENEYVMVIEEINRGNPAQIFGEMLTLLEADKRDPSEALRLAHTECDAERVHIPPNVYVIGTMNVADRSIALVDLALRRRFAFVDLEPTFSNVWRDWVHEQCGIPLDILRTIRARMTALNKRISDDDNLGSQFRVGHSYVTPTPGTAIDDPAKWFAEIVETEIEPLLDEYWFDKASEETKKSAKSELLSGLDGDA